MLKLSARMRKIPNVVPRSGRRNARSTGTLSPPERGPHSREPPAGKFPEVSHRYPCKALRSNEEHEDDDHEGDHRAVREGHAERIVERANPEVLREADDVAARDRAPIRDEATENRGGEEPQEDAPARLRRDWHIHGPERPAKAPETAREEPREPTDLRGLDPRDAREVEVRGHRPHRLPESRAREQEVEDNHEGDRRRDRPCVKVRKRGAADRKEGLLNDPGLHDEEVVRADDD